VSNWSEKDQSSNRHAKKPAKKKAQKANVINGELEGDRLKIQDKKSARKGNLRLKLSKEKGNEGVIPSDKPSGESTEKSSILV